MLARIIDVPRESRRIIIHVPRPVRDEILSPTIEYMAMRISEGIRHINFELLSPWLIAVDTRIGAALRRSVGRFDLRAMKHAFLKIQSSARIEYETVGGVMRIGRIESA